MTDEKIICSQCNKELAMKFIEVKELVFCSNQCIEQFLNTMGQKQFYRKYGDVFLPSKGKLSAHACLSYFILRVKQNYPLHV